MTPILKINQIMSKSEHLTHGELFAGISGFGLGAQQADIKTLWAVEIDVACRKVLKRHYPNIIILEDVMKCGAHNLPPVDIISFGSPCQDMSVAGKRTGLKGARSNLFYEAIRICYELKPTFAVWENVPGALSSNAGRDFASVLASFRDIGARDIAWTVLDAQYFGVAQRRRRVFLVADFRAERAAQILFESEGVSWNPEKIRKQRQSVARPLANSTTTNRGDESQQTFITAFDWQVGDGGNDKSFRGKSRQSIVRSGDYAQLRAGAVDAIAIDVRNIREQPKQGDPNADEPLGFDLAQITSQVNRSNPKPGDPQPPLNTFAQAIVVANTLVGGDNAPQRHGKKSGADRETFIVIPPIAYNIQSNDGGKHRRKDRPDGGLYVNETDTALTVGSTDTTVIADKISKSLTSRNTRIDDDTETFVVAPTLNSSGARTERPSGQEEEPGFYAMDWQPGGDVRLNISETHTSALQANQVPAVSQPIRSNPYNNSDPSMEANMHIVQQPGVRRLTTLECSRLQGFPDDWLNNLDLSDNAKYRMLGNAVAVPCAKWIFKRIQQATYNK